MIRNPAADPSRGSSRDTGSCLSDVLDAFQHFLCCILRSFAEITLSRPDMLDLFPNTVPWITVPIPILSTSVYDTVSRNDEIVSKSNERMYQRVMTDCMKESVSDGTKQLTHNDRTQERSHTRHTSPVRTK